MKALVLLLALPAMLAAQPPQARPKGLSLPFFDNFSLVRNGGPDASLWMPAGGTRVSNNQTDNHPTLNVVGFDGLSRNGLPYDAGNNAPGGAIDTLTSQGIDLSGLTAADSLYLSFFYFRKGASHASDSLRLQLLDNTNNWLNIWLRDGTATDNFVQPLFYVPQGRFLHAGFRFRFLAYGSRSGLFAGYFPDGIYLNRSPGDRYYKDIALRRPISSYLKRYRHMPLAQYRANPALETAATVSTDANNLYNNNNFITTFFQLQELTTGAVIQSYRRPVSENVPQLSAVSVPAGVLPASYAGTRAVLESRFELLTTDDQNPSIGGVNLRRNDTLAAQTILDAFFAYDDGTAEQGVNLSTSGGQLAVRFDLNADDILRAVQLYCPAYNAAATGRKLTLLIMQDAGGQPGTVLRQQEISIQYATTPNAFSDYRLASSAPVSGAFWVALRPTESLPIPLGTDRNNTPQAGRLFMNTGSGWMPNTTLTGALMLRAVVEGRAQDIITGLPAAPAAFTLWPNPPAAASFDGTKLTSVRLRATCPPGGCFTPPRLPGLRPT